MRAMHDLPVLSMFDVIEDANNNSEIAVATIISGEEKGEKALIIDGKLSWVSRDNGFLESCHDSIDIAGGSGVVNLDGREIFVEILGSEKHLVICGAGHVSIPIVRIAKMMGMQVTVIDDREEFTRDAEAAGADAVICKPFSDAFDDVQGSKDTYFVVVTRGHRFDRECVSASLKKPHAYVGMIGSRRHGAIVKQNLLEEGFSQETIDSIYTPIGLSIGAETPAEIAVSIMAEIIEVKNVKVRNFGFPKDIMREITSGERDPEILATIVRKEGSGPRGVGSKMLIRTDGSISGTIGGGSGEAEIISYAAGRLKDGTACTEIRTLDMTASADEDGMVCGGIADVLLEVV